jgi:hypothetical protein
MKNQLLKFTVIICNLLKIVYVVSALAITFFFIHLQINKDFYTNKNIQINFKQKHGEFNISWDDKWGDSISKNDKEVYTLKNLTLFSLYFNYIQAIIILGLLFKIAQEFKNILNSVNSLKTFEKDNIISFRKIGKYLLIYFIVTSYYVFRFKEGSTSSLDINLTPLLLIFLCFILSEIFKEGNSLKQENELTI